MVNKQTEIDDFDKPTSVIIKTKQVSFKITHAYFYEFGDAHDLTELFDIINTSEQLDEIHIHLNNPGGYLSTGIQLISTLDTNVSANIQVYIEAPCYSMGALFATKMMLSGYKTHISRNAYLMFHNYSGGAVGKGNEMYDKLSHDKKWCKSFFTDCTYPFLSQEEIDNLDVDKDLYVWYDKKVNGSISILSRIKQLNKVKK
jgi:ATP-dependent protease ClpP protease subunit